MMWISRKNCYDETCSVFHINDPKHEYSERHPYNALDAAFTSFSFTHSTLKPKHTWHCISARPIFPFIKSKYKNSMSITCITAMPLNKSNVQICRTTRRPCKYKEAVAWNLHFQGNYLRCIPAKTAAPLFASLFLFALKVKFRSSKIPLFVRLTRITSLQINVSDVHQSTAAINVLESFQHIAEGKCS